MKQEVYSVKQIVVIVVGEIPTLRYDISVALFDFKELELLVDMTETELIDTENSRNT